MGGVLTPFLLCATMLLNCTPGECKQTEEGSRARALIIGLVPEQNVFRQLERYTPVAEYLSRKTGLTLKLKVLIRYGNAVDAFVSAGMDGAFLGSLTSVLAYKRAGVEVLARPEDPAGKSTCNGLLFVRADSKIRSISDMKGKRAVFVDKASTAGYLFPLVYLKQRGVADHRSYFKETYFSGTHEDAVRDVLDGRSEIGAAKNTVFARMAAADAKILRRLKILSMSRDLPENGMALSTGVPASTRNALRDALLNMHRDPGGIRVLVNFGAQRFIPTTNEDFEPVLRYAREARLNLVRYDYVNHQ